MSCGSIEPPAPRYIQARRRSNARQNQTIKPWATADAIVVDPKGDEYLRKTLVAEAERAGKQLVEWSPAGPTSYNPLGHGSPSEIAVKALAAETYTEPL